MTKRDLVIRIANETGMVQQDVQAIIQKTLDYMTDELANGGHIEFRDFGVFEIHERKPRIGRNPKRPEHTVQIPARKVVKFKAGKKMKELVLNA